MDAEMNSKSVSCFVHVRWCFYWPTFHRCVEADICFFFNLQNIIPARIMDFIAPKCVFLNLCKKDVISFRPQITLTAIPSVNVAGMIMIVVGALKIKKRTNTQTKHSKPTFTLNHTLCTQYEQPILCMNWIRSNRIINTNSWLPSTAMQWNNFRFLCAHAQFSRITARLVAVFIWFSCDKSASKKKYTMWAHHVTQP